MRPLWRRYLDKIMKPGFLRVMEKYKETKKARRRNDTWYIGNPGR